ncbi:MAG: DUF1343 domain-containing protein, partial [Bdellovibrionales bacterium]|nr:DUF1343 domain-containing protein [Bdellovibrionales bacterium]
MQLGSERLLDNLKKYPELRQKRVGLLAHPASVNSNLQHIVDYLTGNQISLTCAFGPQHGMLGDKQDNMIESKDYVDPRYGIPIYSLYSDVRRPTPKMLDSFDILLVDLQDVGTRIYTYITTLIYFLQECQNSDRQIWILDRPNPIGRKIEGHILSLEYESFVGAAEMPMRHG